MTLVADASVVVSGLTDGGAEGRWAETLLAEQPLVAPHLMPAEVSNILRRASAAALLPPAVAALAHAQLLLMPVELFPYAPFAQRVWELRETVTSYDAWYVALAESLSVPLATLDRRLARASGPDCTFLVPPLAPG